MTAVLAFFAGPIGRWIVVAALVASALFAGGAYERSVGYKEGIDVGAKELQAQAKANAKAVVALDQKYRKQEQTQAAELAAQGVEYEKNLKVAQDIRDRDVANARSGALKLRIPSNCRSADAGKLPDTPSPSSGGNDSATIELPATVTGRLYALADDADSVVNQLSACQTVIKSYLK